MTDCYRILGVPRHASPAEIRAAYLAKMKQLHPDARRDGSAAGGEAGEISFAYWQLRDGGRRAEHDRLLYAACAPRPSRAGERRRRKTNDKAVRRAAPARKGKAGGRRRGRGARRLEPLRAAAGAAACAFAISGFALAFTYFDPQTGLRARAATVLDGSEAVARSAPVTRRKLDATMKAAAASAFREIVGRSGLEGAHRYARQCLLELTARPTMTMLDFCVAFEDLAAKREQGLQASGTRARRYFAEDQRFGRYTSVARELRPGVVREAMIADIGFLAVRDD